jgi:uncharacterized protein
MNLNIRNKRYNQYSKYLEGLFNCKVYKITIDAGFNCPNRDGTISYDGCIFCDSKGSFSQAHSSCLSVEQQIEAGIEKLGKRFKAKKFIAYFQAFSNTYSDVETLKKVYDKAFLNEKVVGMSIGTRPDCIDSERIELISSYALDKEVWPKEVWIEYGLQTINDKTLNFLNRGHSAQDFVNAVKLTQNKGIKICAHVIIGLPDETREDVLNTAKLLADLGIDGVKIHLLCVLKDTKLEEMYQSGNIKLLEPDEYVSMTCDFLELLPPDTIIQRLAGNGLKKILVAPKWLGAKFEILNLIDAELKKRNTFQGIFYKKSSL